MLAHSSVSNSLETTDDTSEAFVTATLVTVPLSVTITASPLAIAPEATKLDTPNSTLVRLEPSPYSVDAVTLPAKETDDSLFSVTTCKESYKRPPV